METEQSEQEVETETDSAAGWNENSHATIQTAVLDSRQDQTNLFQQRLRELISVGGFATPNSYLQMHILYKRGEIRAALCRLEHFPETW